MRETYNRRWYISIYTSTGDEKEWWFWRRCLL